MQVMVETFEQTEEAASGVKEEDRNEEALALIEKLGLEGQQQMIKKKETGVVLRCPYRQMNVTELRVYEALYPQKTTIARYNQGMIPLRVLQVAAHAKSLECFKEIQIWGEKSVPKDPILVGLMQNPERSWSEDVFILARWGNALEAFEVLRERARKTLAAQYKAQCEKTQSECAKILSCLEAIAEEHLSGGAVYIPS
jgi:hypothetical protein